MRSGRTAAILAVLLPLAVVLMHLGMPPMAMSSMPGASTAHHGASSEVKAAERTAIDRADHDTSVQKQTVDAVHDHEAHDCAGTVVVHKSVGAPPLVAVLPIVDDAGRSVPAVRGALARGPPPWTVHDLSQLCVLRV